MTAPDIDLSAGVLTVIQEAGGEDDPGQLAVAYAIRNSCVHWGRSLTDEVFKRNRYSCWRDDSPTPYNLDQANEKTIASCTVAMLQAWFYLVPDPTRGAVFYMNTEVVIKVRGSLPDWWHIDASAGGQVVIGNHTFRPPILTRV